MVTAATSRPAESGMEARDRRLRRLLGLAALAALACGLVYLLRAPLLTALGGLLIADDNLEEADLLFLLNGDVETRPFHLAALYRRGLAPRVAVAQVKPSPPVELGLAATETAIALQVLTAEGVPQEAVAVLPYDGGVASTYDEALALADYVAAEAIDRVIVVTSAFHTTRSRWIVERVVAEADPEVEVQVTAAPHWAFDVTNWWRTEEGFLYFVTECVKWGYYLVHY